MLTVYVALAFCMHCKPMVLSNIMHKGLEGEGEEPFEEVGMPLKKIRSPKVDHPRRGSNFFWSTFCMPDQSRPTQYGSIYYFLTCNPKQDLGR